MSGSDVLDLVPNDDSFHCKNESKLPSTTSVNKVESHNLSSPSNLSPALLHAYRILTTYPKITKPPDPYITQTSPYHSCETYNLLSLAKLPTTLYTTPTPSSTPALSAPFPGSNPQTKVKKNELVILQLSPDLVLHHSTIITTPDHVHKPRSFRGTKRKRMGSCLA